MSTSRIEKSRKIAQLGDAILYQRAHEITEVNDPIIQQIAKDLLTTFQEENATGMAAPQLGHSIRMMVIGVSEERARKHGYDGEIPTTLLINPTIEYLDKTIEMTWEACYSIPGKMGWVPRHRAIRYSGLTLDNQYVTREATGFHAYIVQHEYDHLNGILYPMRINEAGKYGFAEIIDYVDEFIGLLPAEYLTEFGVDRDLAYTAEVTGYGSLFNGKDKAINPTVNTSVEEDSQAQQRRRP